MNQGGTNVTEPQRPPTDYDADLADAVRFHGHLCPGLAIGFRAAKAALERLGARRSEDEELIAIVENDSCSVDAVQWLTGCTFGKGNFFFRDHGKQVSTFALRPGGRAVRVALKSPDRCTDQPPHQNRDARTRWILEVPLDHLFDIRDMNIALPPRAEIRETVTCDRCGEPVMDSRTVRRGAQTLCRPCAAQAS